MANEIFISYCRKDIDKVREIKKSLDRELEINCWMDLNGIESGDQFKNVIISAINRHDTVLFMMTSDSMQSPYALKELNFAEKKGKRIVLIDLDHTTMTDDFMFDYGNKDIIDWEDALQRNKLIRDLKKWGANAQGEILNNDDLEEDDLEEDYTEVSDSVPYYRSWGWLKKFFLILVFSAVITAVAVHYFYNNDSSDSTIVDDYSAVFILLEECAEEMKTYELHLDLANCSCNFNDGKTVIKDSPGYYCNTGRNYEVWEVKGFLWDDNYDHVIAELRRVDHTFGDEIQSCKIKLELIGYNYMHITYMGGKYAPVIFGEVDNDTPIERVFERR